MRSFVTDSLFLSNTTAGKLIERTHSEPLSLRYLGSVSSARPDVCPCLRQPAFSRAQATEKGVL